MSDTVVFDGEYNLILSDNAESNIDFVLDGDFGVHIDEGRLPVYDGITEVTPSQEEQILDTSQHALYQNIIINPIPSNYGLITWNGSTLTVS